MKEKRLVDESPFSVTKTQDTMDTLKISKVISGIKTTVIDTEGIGSIEKITADQLVEEFKVQGIGVAQGLDGIVLCVTAGRLDMLFNLETETLKGMFGDDILNHVIVVFTKIKDLKDSTYEQWIKKYGDDIRTRTGLKSATFFGVDNNEGVEHIVSYIIKKAKEKRAVFIVDNNNIQNLVNTWKTDSVKATGMILDLFKKVVETSPLWKELVKAIPFIGTIAVVVEQVIKLLQHVAK